MNLKKLLLALTLTLTSTLTLVNAMANDTNNTIAKATFAGGCFWCMEPPFDKLDGVISTTSGYAGGESKNPSYEEVSSGITGHTEAIQIEYDPSKVSYETLLEIFWQNIDPLDAGGQFCDRGSQYRSEIFVHDEIQAKAAVESKNKTAEKLGKSIVTDISQTFEFYPAEDYHQNYYQRNPIRYKFYRHGCGRDKRLKELWHKNS